MSVNFFISHLICPECGTGLSIDKTRGQIVCSNKHSYPYTQDVPYLVLPEEKDSLTRHLKIWEEKRLDQGWGNLKDEEVRCLPFSDPSGYPPIYLKLQRAGYQKLVKILRDGISGSVPPSEKGSLIADVGCGLGWLAHQLSRLDYRVLAMDPLTEGPLGLLRGRNVFGMNENLGFVAGTALHPPLKIGVWRVIILNAALQLMPDPEEILGALHKVLSANQRKDTILVIMNTPLDADGFIERPDKKKSDRTLEDYLEKSSFEVLRCDRSFLYLKSLDRLTCNPMISSILAAVSKNTLQFPFVILRAEKSS